MSIIHSSAVKKSTGEPNSSNDDQQSQVTQDDIDAVRVHFEQLETSDLVTEPDQTPNEDLGDGEPEPEPEPEPEAEAETESEIADKLTPSEAGTNGDYGVAAGASTHNADQAKGHNLVNVRFKNNKQHTGMKNMSFGVGAAVTPTTKMEFYEEPSADYGVVKINQPTAGIKKHDDNASIISSANSSDGFTMHGYCDIKFHHNKLW